MRLRIEKTKQPKEEPRVKETPAKKRGYHILKQSRVGWAGEREAIAAGRSCDLTSGAKRMISGGIDPLMQFGAIITSDPLCYNFT